MRQLDTSQNVTIKLWPATLWEKIRYFFKPKYSYMGQKKDGRTIYINRVVVLKNELVVYDAMAIEFKPSPEAMMKGRAGNA